MKVTSLLWIVFVAVGTTAVAVPEDKRSPVPQRSCDNRACATGCAHQGKAGGTCLSNGMCSCS
ncbi:hypothetical protein VTL71DRAFT_4332 [Oculimacula yallundae]|uniref:Invertebrate defensins family profile domain-containing protein n=1 Tax=Oculimacula yallundae TaxID=86028 RepID=A0ABR4C1L9_9HELO